MMYVHVKYFFWRSSLLLLVAIGGFVVSRAQQRRTSAMVFAPTEGWVKDVERPYREAVCLNGSWQFQPIALPVDFKEGEDPTPALPAVNDEKWSTVAIKIPSPWNVNSFADKNKGGDFRAYPSYPEEWEKIKMGWLKRRFEVPASWKGKRIQLHFEAVAGDAVVIINGKEVGRHADIFMPFDVDITDAIELGKDNTLLIGVRKASLFDKKSAHGRRTYQAGSFWGQHIAGIWQDVFLIALPEVAVTNTFIKPLVDSNRLAVVLTLHNYTGKKAEVDVSGAVYAWLGNHDKEGLASPEPSSRLSARAALDLSAKRVQIPAYGESTLEIMTSVNGQLQLWSPDKPNLYGLVVQLQKGKQLVDRKYERFGWRQTNIIGGQFLLNGKPLVMKGDSWHFMGIPQMTRRYAWAWYKTLQDAHMNAVRLHAQPYPSFYLDMADEMGILVLDETAVWASDGGPNFGDERYWQDSEKHLSSLILRDRNHPSVFGWSISNEVMPVIVNVMRNPPGFRDRLIEYYGIWASICRKLDPTRQWISADGEEDGAGKLPTYVVHYGGKGGMDKAKNSGKPWGVGEDGNAYYGTPLQVAETNSSRAYESFLGRMEGVALSSYQSLAAQAERSASYRSVFNLAWYGLKPLPFGLADTTKSPTLDDGIYFTSFQEGQPGIQPERLGPYTSTFNPGYDPALPLYETWPLFDAIKSAAMDKPFTIPEQQIEKAVDIRHRDIQDIAVLGGQGSELESDLKRLGIPLKAIQRGEVPDLLFIDGVRPPDQAAAQLMEQVTHKGGLVWIWGASVSTLSQLNALLPLPITVNNRQASSLLIKSPSALTAGMTHADWYFSERIPADITKQGLEGELVQQSTVLLEANPTDWLKWNKQPEYAKTGMVIRSERETKPSGAVLIWKQQASGGLFVSTLPSKVYLPQAVRALQHVFTNLGIHLIASGDLGKAISPSGLISQALVLGSFPVNRQDGEAKNRREIILNQQSFKLHQPTAGKTWQLAYGENGLIDLRSLALKGPQEHAEAYLSFWISSPRSLEDLLIEPNMPQVNLEVEADDAVQVWLNGDQVLENHHTGPIRGSKAVVESLKLKQGWNHVLIKVTQESGEWQLRGRLTCNEPAFLSELGSALEKP